MNVGSSLDSAITSLQRNVESAKSVASQLSKTDDEATSSGPTVNAHSETVGQMINETA